MVDRPRDKPQLGRPASVTRRDPAAAPETPGEIGGREVIAYLRRHPDFLEQHPEALRLLRTPSRELGEDVFDFQHFHSERLRQDLARVNLEHRTLIAASRGTLASQGRVHKAVLAILAAAAGEALLQMVTTDLAGLLDVDVVTVGVESTTASGGRLSIHGIHLLKAGAIDALLGPERTLLLRADQPGETVLFGAARTGALASLTALGFGRVPIGLCASARARPAGSTPASAPSC